MYSSIVQLVFTDTRGAAGFFLCDSQSREVHGYVTALDNQEYELTLTSSRTKIFCLLRSRVRTQMRAARRTEHAILEE